MKQKRIKRRNEYQDREKPRFCDPAACQFCEHLGGGDFVCMKDPMDRVGVLVVAKWQATAKYLYCKRYGGQNHYGRMEEKRNG